jgi:hypothetical protein
MIQTKRDLGRTRYTEETQKKRRAMKNTPLQSGGVLTVAAGRHMVQQREEDEVAKARKVVKAADDKHKKTLKKGGFKAAKLARKWRMLGKLAPVEVYEKGVVVKYLKRF